LKASASASSVSIPSKRRRIRLTRGDKAADLAFAREDYGDLVRDPDFTALQRECWYECIPDKERRPFNPDHGRYSRLMAGSFMHVYTARCRGRLAGFASYLIFPTLHHGPKYIEATLDVWFVGKPYRRGRAGLRLLEFALDGLRDYGVSTAVHHNRTPARDVLFRSLTMHKGGTVWAKSLNC
jgi:Acetyltransferase (GNAT) family